MFVNHFCSDIGNFPLQRKFLVKTVNSYRTGLARCSQTLSGHKNPIGLVKLYSPPFVVWKPAVWIAYLTEPVVVFVTFGTSWIKTAVPIAKRNAAGIPAAVMVTFSVHIWPTTILDRISCVSRDWQDVRFNYWPGENNEISLWFKISIFLSKIPLCWWT